MGVSNYLKGWFFFFLFREVYDANPLIAKLYTSF